MNCTWEVVLVEKSGIIITKIDWVGQENVIIEEGVYFQNPKDIKLSVNIWIDKQAILIAELLIQR
jgi:alkylated DNA nucleotide flippase Atl1